MITIEQTFPLLLEACPSFQDAYRKSVAAWGADLPYLKLGDLARHLLELYQQGKTAEIETVAEVIERLHCKGDQRVREAVTIGLLEGIQNVWRSNGVDPELFYPFLRAESRRWWQSLDLFWQGTIRFVGEDLSEGSVGCG